MLSKPHSCGSYYMFLYVKLILNQRVFFKNTIFYIYDNIISRPAWILNGIDSRNLKRFLLLLTNCELADDRLS